VGKRVRIDDRWRITIPVEFREGLKPKDELIIERRGSMIILKKASGEDVLKKFREIKLYVDEKYRYLDAEKGKHRYGGLKI